MNAKKLEPTLENGFVHDNIEQFYDYVHQKVVEEIVLTIILNHILQKLRLKIV